MANERAGIGSSAQTGCFAFRKGEKGGKVTAKCTALNECYCANGEYCAFYMTKKERREKAARARFKNARNGIFDSADWEKESKRL